MNRSLRIGVAVAALAAGLGLAGSSAAHAQVAFEGHFRLPHGRVSIRSSHPYFPVGSHVPRGHRIRHLRHYGYGFYTPVSYCRAHHARHAHWIPVRRHRARWIVVGHPVVVLEKRVYRPYGYGAYRNGYGYDGRHDDGYGRYDEFDRYDGRGYRRGYSRDDRDDD